MCRSQCSTGYKPGTGSPASAVQDTSTAPFLLPSFCNALKINRCLAKRRENRGQCHAVGVDFSNGVAKDCTKNLAAVQRPGQAARIEVLQLADQHFPRGQDQGAHAPTLPEKAHYTFTAELSQEGRADKFRP